MRRVAAVALGALFWAGVLTGCGSAKAPAEGPGGAPSGAPDGGDGSPPSDPGGSPTLPIATDPGGAVAPDSAAVHYAGRFDRSDPAGPVFAWPGSSIGIKFTGTHAEIRLTQGTDSWSDSSGTPMQNEYDVYLDGVLQDAPLVTSADQTDYTLASGLDDAVHTLQVVKRTESAAGSGQFLGFVFDDGATVDTPDVPTGHLEFIGDAVTAGYGVLGADETCGFSPQTEDVDQSFAALTAHALNAEWVAEADQIKGVLLNADPTDLEPMPVVYSRVRPDDPELTWDPSSWTPDAIVLELGANDFTAGDPGPDFVTAYEDFLATLRANNPNALLVVTLGPTLDDSAGQLTAARGYLQQVVDDAQAAGDANLALLEFPSQDGTLGFGCDWYPSEGTQQQMADQLTPLLHDRLGW